MQLKRVARLALCVVLAASAIGCGGGSPKVEKPSSSPVQPSPSEQQSSCPVQPSLSEPQTQALNAMLQEVPTHITQAIAHNQDSLPRNPHLASFIQAKIALLQSPTLASDISSQQLYFVSAAASMDGRAISIVTIYPDKKMCTEAAAAVQELTDALPVVEQFMGIPLPLYTSPSAIRVWYGFVIGNSAGGGMLEMEDKTTYQARGGGIGPYEAILDHELSHSYIAHESLNQFLELYAYNMLRTKSNDVRSWTFTRDYLAFQTSNERIHAVLDVYQWLGKDAMASAYQAVYPLHPAYGVELCDLCKQVFIDRAPESRKTDVAAKMNMVGP